MIALLQATIEYFQPHVTSKFVVGLNSTLPVEANACVGWNGFVAGGKATIDVRSSRVSSYSLACAYQGPGFTATGHATEKFGKIVGTYWQKIDTLSAIAAEVVHEPSSNDVGLTMGYSHIEPDGAQPSTCHPSEFWSQCCFSSVCVSGWDFLPRAQAVYTKHTCHEQVVQFRLQCSCSSCTHFWCWQTTWFCRRALLFLCCFRPRFMGFEHVCMHEQTLSQK